MTDNDRTLDPNDHRWKNRRIAELVAERDQYKDMIGDIMIATALIAEALGVESEPHQTSAERLVEKARSVVTEVERLRDALEFISESHDSGRCDGRPEPCPAHDDVTMWALAREALAATEGSDGDEKADSEWLDIIEGECWDLRCLDVATFGGDYEVEWIVIEHHQAAPRQRQIGRGDSPVTALQDAVARTTPAPPTTDAEEE